MVRYFAPFGLLLTGLATVTWVDKQLGYGITLAALALISPNHPPASLP